MSDKSFLTPSELRSIYRADLVVHDGKIAPPNTVKLLDEAASLLHRYNFAIVGERDELVRCAYKIIAELSLDISLLNVPFKESVNAH